jgi:hypothetical protein
MIVSYSSSVVNKPEDLLTDDARVVIYNRHVFIVQANGVFWQHFGIKQKTPQFPALLFYSG